MTPQARTALNLLAFALSIAALCVVVMMAEHYNHDDSDAPGEHSGLVPRVDAKTGCEYLTTPFGFGITPRLDRDGRQVCTR